MTFRLFVDINVVGVGSRRAGEGGKGRIRAAGVFLLSLLFSPRLRMKRDISLILFIAGNAEIE